MRARCREGGVLHHLPREVGHLQVVAVGLVRLEHRELGRVRRVGTLVAEVAVDLVDAVDAAHHGALEEQLGRDPQEQLDVEGVAVRGEGTSGCPAVHHLQHGGLDLDVVVRSEGAAQGGDRRGAGPDHLARSLARDEVEIAAAHPRLLAELGVQVGEGAQRLRRDLPLADHDRQLAATARDDLAGDEEVIAEVDELLPQVEGLLADLGETHHRLDARAVTRLDGGEAQLAGVAQVHDAAREADGLPGGRVGLEALVGGADGGDRRGDRHPHRIRLEALGDETVALGEAHGLLLGHLEVEGLAIRFAR